KTLSPFSCLSPANRCDRSNAFSCVDLQPHGAALQTQSAFHATHDEPLLHHRDVPLQIQIVRPLEATTETQPQLQPVLLRLRVVAAHHSRLPALDLRKPARRRALQSTSSRF